MKHLRIWLLLWAAISVASPLWGQQSDAPQAAQQTTAPETSPGTSSSASGARNSPPPSAPAEIRRGQDNGAQSGQASGHQEGHQRILGVVPNFSVVEDQSKFHPLTVHEKWSLYSRQTFDPFHFIATGFGAGIGQARDSFPEYGQGMQGYGKRYGAGFADSSLGSFFGGFVLPSLLHDDPRYFRRGSGPVMHRALYAASRVFVTRHDDGQRRPNYPGILGAFIGTGFGNLYYPANERGAGTTFVRGAQVLDGAAIGFIFQEFWPDIHDKIFKKHKINPAPNPAP